MAAYLEGSDAFETVLERLIDAERRAMRAEQHASDLARERTLTADLKASIVNAKPKLKALWNAANTVAQVLQRGETPIPDDAVQALAKALTVSCAACDGDEIPF